MSTIDFQERFSDLNDLLFAFAMKLTRNKEDAKDLMQETVCRAFKYRDRFAVGTNFKAWITTIMRNQFINGYRKKKTRNKVEAPIDDFLFAIENRSEPNKAESAIFVKEVFGMLDSLTETYRVPFYMFYKGYQYSEIAEHLNIPIGTVKSRIFLARKKMKDMIQARYKDNLTPLRA